MSKNHIEFRVFVFYKIHAIDAAQQQFSYYDDIFSVSIGPYSGVISNSPIHLRNSLQIDRVETMDSFHFIRKTLTGFVHLE